MTSRRYRSGRFRWSILICAGVLSSLLTGCVHRQFVITSDPPGALVQVNGKTVGVTPVDFPFTYYGSYRITLIKEDWETLAVEQPVYAPWYEWFPLDFVSEHLIPWTYSDVQRFHYKMKRLQLVPPEVVRDRAEQARQFGRGIGGPAMAPGQPIMVPGQPVPGLGQPIPSPPPGEALPNPSVVPPGAGANPPPPPVTQNR